MDGGRLCRYPVLPVLRHMSSSTAYEASTMATPTTLISSPARHNLSFMKMKLANVVSPAVTVEATSRGTANTASP